MRRDRAARGGRFPSPSPFARSRGAPGIMPEIATQRTKTPFKTPRGRGQAKPSPKGGGLFEPGGKKRKRDEEVRSAKESSKSNAMRRDGRGKKKSPSRVKNAKKQREGEENKTGVKAKNRNTPGEFFSLR